MPNINLGPDYQLALRLSTIERQLQNLATSPILLNASTGQTGGRGLSTDINGLHLYDPTGQEVIRLDTTSGTFYAFGQVGQATVAAGGSVGSTIPILTFSTFDGGGVQTAGTQVYQSYNEFLMAGPKTSTNSGSQAYFTLKDSGAWAKVYGTSGSGVAYLNIANNGTFYLGNWGATCGVYTSAQNGPVLVIGGLTVSGTKNFVMDHPTKPGYILKHASTESPHNGVEYWGTVTLDASGQAVVTLPDYFEALTYPDNRNIQLTPIGRATVPVSADRISGGSFTVYGAAGQEVDWLVKAVRQSTNPDEPIDFDVVSLKDTTPPPPPAESAADPRMAAPAELSRAA